jgi:guanosine-3',5'-bis(diphosphate) 3'-pyrophosphohydrolase
VEKILDNLRRAFKDENDLLELVEDALRFSRLEWDIWTGEKETNQRRKTLQQMYLLAIGEVQSRDQTQDLLTSRRFQKKEKQSENLIRLLLVIANDARTLIIKLANRLSLMKILGDLPPIQRETLYYELLAKITLTIYAPLAERLGIWALKSELEDISFRLLEPEKYIQITQGRSRKMDGEKSYITSIIIPTVRDALKQEGIEAEITGREKQIYSIYQKMKAKQMTLEETNDLWGIRIIVDKEVDCYKALGVLFSRWQPVTDIYGGKAGRDWIANPKENKYQSIHTTIYFKQSEETPLIL